MNSSHKINPMPYYDGIHIFSQYKHINGIKSMLAQFCIDKFSWVHVSYITLPCTLYINHVTLTTDHTTCTASNGANNIVVKTIKRTMQTGLETGTAVQCCMAQCDIMNEMYTLTRSKYSKC